MLTDVELQVEMNSKMLSGIECIYRMQEGDNPRKIRQRKKNMAVIPDNRVL